jgi:medium-chain acyl-[acyl-carrier-protein] hydrolase
MASNQNSGLARQDEYTIRSYEVDIQGKATMPLLCRFMQESASNHAEQLGLGISWLTENNLAWVLTRQRVVMDAYPKWGETIQIITWPTGRDHLLWYRDFKLLDGDGNILGKATTAWLVIDPVRRRPQRTDTLPSLDPPSDVERAFSRWPEKLPALSEDAPSHFIRVRYRDLDVNEHVNNAQYVEWTLEAFDLDFHRMHLLKEIEINYLIEALYGDTLSSHCEDIDGKTFLHSLIRGADGLELFRARTVWEPSQ